MLECIVTAYLVRCHRRLEQQWQSHLETERENQGHKQYRQGSSKRMQLKLSTALHKPLNMADAIKSLLICNVERMNQHLILLESNDAKNPLSYHCC